MKEKRVVQIYNVLSILLKWVIPFILLFILTFFVIGMTIIFSTDSALIRSLIIFCGSLIFGVWVFLGYIDLVNSIIPNFVKSYKNTPEDYIVEKYRFKFRSRLPKNIRELLPWYATDRSGLKRKKYKSRSKLQVFGENKKNNIVYKIYDFEYKLEAIKPNAYGIATAALGTPSGGARRKQLLSFNGDMFEVTVPNINFNDCKYIYINDNCYKLFKGGLFNLENAISMGKDKGFIRYDKKDEEHISLIKKIAKMDFITKFDAEFYLMFKANKIIVITNYGYPDSKSFYKVEDVRDNIEKQKKLSQEFEIFLKGLSELKS